MKSTIRGKIGRLAMSFMVALAILGGVGVGIATGTTDSHAAIKWHSATGPHGNGNAYGQTK